MYPASVSVGRPLWIPTRTCTSRPSPQARLPSSRWIATAASMAAAARSKTAKNSSARASISRPTLALEVGHAALVSFGGERNRLARTVQVRARSVRPVQDSEGRIPEDGSQPLFELTGCRVPTQLDHEATGRRSSPLRLQQAGDEPDGHDAVLLRRVQQPVAGALPGGIVLEGDLVEPGQGIPHVGLVVDRQPPPAARVDVGERPIGEAGSRAGLARRRA